MTDQMQTRTLEAQKKNTLPKDALQEPLSYKSSLARMLTTLKDEKLSLAQKHERLIQLIGQVEARLQSQKQFFDGFMHQLHSNPQYKLAESNNNIREMMMGSIKAINKNTELLKDLRQLTESF